MDAVTELKQLINDVWYAQPETEDCTDLTPYASSFDKDACVKTAIPALAKDLFPTAETPLWFY